MSIPSRACSRLLHPRSLATFQRRGLSSSRACRQELQNPESPQVHSVSQARPASTGRQSESKSKKRSSPGRRLDKRESNSARNPGKTTTGVEIQVEGQPHTFSPILLRDLCECSQCVDPSTKQKYRPTTDIPVAIKPRALSQDDNGVSILWDNDVPGYRRDHSTEISANVLRQYVQSGSHGIANSSLGPRTLWNANQYGELSDLTYEEYMESDSALYRTLQKLHTHGLVFLTDVPGSEKSVSTIAERIGPVKNTFYGYTWDVRSVPNSKNVAYTSQDLGFHMDLLYMEQPPHLQFLHCIRSSSAGGASLFTDSFRAASDLLEDDEEAFRILRLSPINFHYNHPSSALYHFQRPVLEFGAAHYRGGAGRLLEDYIEKKRAVAKDSSVGSEDLDAMNPVHRLKSVAWSPPFQGPMGQKPAINETRAPAQFTSERLDDWHGAAQTFNKLIHRPEMIYERLMKPGECVLFDNRRVLHARKAFEVADLGKERWLRGAYLDKDPYMSKMRVLAHQLGQSGQNNTNRDQSEHGTQDYFEKAAAAA